MNGWGAAGAVAAGGAGIAGIIGAVRRAKAIARAADQAQRFEEFKFREFFEDALDEERRVVEGNRQAYAARGIDFMAGSPLAVEVDVANEYARNIDRARREMEMRKEQIRLDAKAGRASSIISGVSSGLNAGTTITGILGRP